VGIGPEFIPDDQRAGDYVITVDDGGAPVSRTVMLGDLTPLPAGGPTMVDTSTGFLTPTVSTPAIAGATHYRISVSNDSDSTSRTFDGVSGRNLSSSPSIQLGPGIIEEGKFYRFRIQAFDAATVSGSGRRTESEDVCYDPFTGITNIPCIAQKDVFLVTEADGTDVILTNSRVLDLDDLDYLKNPPLTDPPTVPVTVTRDGFGPFPLTVSPLRSVGTDSDVTDRFTSGRNPLDANQIPVDERAGVYTFRAEDGTGNVVTVTRELPENLMALPVAGPLTISSSSGLTPTISMPDVTGATHYRVTVFNDTDSTRFNFDNLPGSTLAESPSVKLFDGVLEPNKAYRIRMGAFNASTFSSSTVRSRSAFSVYDPDDLDADDDGIQDNIDGQFNGGFVPESASSNNFTNQHLEGTVFGSIIDPADVSVVVVTPPVPASGVNIGAAGGFGSATLEACGIQMLLTDGDSVVVNCGSLTTEVLQGPIEVLPGDIIVNAPTGAMAEVTEVDEGQFDIVNLGTTGTIVVEFQGQVINYKPGTSGVPVSIDIKPGTDTNSWPCNKINDDIPVAILSNEGFDATSVDADSVLFGKTGTEAAEVHMKNGNAKRHVEDVDKDGLLDMVFHFRFGDTGFSCNDNSEGGKSVFLNANLTGTANGTPIMGEDTLRLVLE